MVGCDQMQRYPKGSSVPVRLNPNDPANSLAEGNDVWPSYTIVPVLFAVFWLFIVSSLAIARVRKNAFSRADARSPPILEPDSKVCHGAESRAILRVSIRIEAIFAHAVELSMERSQSLARRRQRPSQAKVRSTTQRRGNTSNPLTVSDRLMISSVHSP